MSASHEIDQDKLEEFMGRFVGDLGAAMSAALVVIGDRLGLYAAIADGQPITAEELASRTRATRAFSVQNRPRGVREASTGAILHHRGAFPAKRSGRPGCLASFAPQSAPTRPAARRSRPPRGSFPPSPTRASPSTIRRVPSWTTTKELTR